VSRSAPGVGAQLAEIYALGDGEGANRPGLGAAEQAAHDLVAGWMRAAGLEVSRDAAGNLYGRLPGAEPGEPEVWSGSHLDSVPRGGRFDGALGVVAAVEALRRIAATGARPRRTLAAVAFRDEEGWRFGRGFFGSRAVAGALEPGTLDTPDADGVTVRAALERLSLAVEEPGGGLVALPRAFVEVHIEQGPVLADRDAPLGVVESIAGLIELDVRFHGREGHAGTTPMHLRRDAGAAAARFHVAVTEAAAEIDGAVATIGRLALEPGASNVIPGLSRMVVDARAPDDDRRDRLAAVIRREADRAAERHGCRAEVTVTARNAAVIADARVRAALAAAAPGAPVLPSGAGHDAQVLAAAGVPVGMLFVRSLAGGISHSPLEESGAEDVAGAVAALTAALTELSG
jgi:hydantoinase/carbamoylase family amidase